MRTNFILHEIILFKESVEASTISIRKDNIILNESFVSCGYLNENTQIPLTNHKNSINLKCPYNKFGSNCSTTVLIDDSWHKICEYNSQNCMCLWGYFGNNCSQSKCMQ